MKCCKDCQWYFLDGRIKDEKGKHVCYGHYLICTPFIYVNSLSEDNQCDFFENRKRNMSHKELEDEWRSRGIIFRKSMDI